jgi:hypothetical protein
LAVNQGGYLGPVEMRVSTEPSAAVILVGSVSWFLEVNFASMAGHIVLK